MANLAIVAYNNKTYPNRKYVPILARVKDTREMLHPRESIEYSYKHYDLANKVVVVYFHEKNRKEYDGMDIWCKQAYGELRNKMYIFVEAKLTSIKKDDMVNMKFKIQYFDVGKEEWKPIDIELYRKGEIEKFIYNDYIERGKIDKNSIEFYVNNQKVGYTVDYKMVRTPHDIHDKTYYENELKITKAKIQLDEEEAQKLMNKDFDKSKIIEEIQRKIEECEENEESYGFAKSLEDIIEQIMQINMRFVENPGYDEDHQLCLEVFKAYSLKLYELFKRFSWVSNYEYCYTNDIIKLVCGTSLALKASEVSEILDYLKEYNFIQLSYFERDDIVGFPKFCELFLRIAYFKFSKSRENGDQVFTFLYKDLSDSVFYNNGQFAKDFLVETAIDEKTKKTVRGYIRDLIDIYIKKSHEKYVPYCINIDDEWFCQMMNYYLSEDDYRKCKQYVRMYCLKNQTNCEADKEVILVFFSDYVNALLYLSINLNWKDAKYKFENKDKLEARIAFIFTKFCNDIDE